MKNFIRAGLWALALSAAVLGTGSAALAKAVTAPGPGIKPYQPNIAVNWNGFSGPDVNILLSIGNSSGALVGIVNFANNTANDGNQSIGSGPCYNLPNGYQYFVTVYKSSNMMDAATSKGFRFVCPIDPRQKKRGETFDAGKFKSKDGRMAFGPWPHNPHPKKPAGGRVTKVVDNQTGGTFTMPNSFPIVVMCDPPGLPFPYFINLPTAANAWSSFNAYDGEHCMATEFQIMPPVPAKGCESGFANWAVTPSQSQVMKFNQARSFTVKNTLVCTKPPGKIKIEKVLLNDTGMPVSTPQTYTMNLLCIPGSITSLTASVSPGSPAVISTLAAGVKCTITEVPPATITFAEGCRGPAYWETTVSGQVIVPVTGTNTVTVTNKLTCKKPDGGGNGGGGNGDKKRAGLKGSLTIATKVEVEGPIPAPKAAFNVKVSCTPQGPKQTFKVLPANPLVLDGLAMGTSCAVMELEPEVPLDLLRRDCRWMADTMPRKISIGDFAPSRATIVNKWTCKSDAVPGGDNGYKPRIPERSHDQGMDPRNRSEKSPTWSPSGDMTGDGYKRGNPSDRP